MRKCDLQRAGQVFQITSREWKKAGPGNNFILLHFLDPRTEVVSYFVGTITSMIACKHYQLYRLVAIMDIEAVRPVTISCDQDDGSTFSTVLSNLWEKIPGRKVQQHMCPVFDIPHKTMLCEDGKKRYHCVYR